MAIIYGIPDSKKQLEKSLRKSILVASGAKGELAVLDKISELDDNYHILCNVNVNLGHLITDPISKRKDLKKAQMDFVIISKRGVMVIEVKNWSEEYILKNKINIEKYGGKTPHAQTHRNGLVLWIELNPSNRQKKISVTKILLATHGNMQFDPTYEMVHVKDLTNINNFIQNQTKQFSDEEVKEIIISLGKIPKQTS